MYLWLGFWLTCFGMFLFYGPFVVLLLYYRKYVMNVTVSLCPHSALFCSNIWSSLPLSYKDFHHDLTSPLLYLTTHHFRLFHRLLLIEVLFKNHSYILIKIGIIQSYVLLYNFDDDSRYQLNIGMVI